MGSGQPRQFLFYRPGPVFITGRIRHRPRTWPRPEAQGLGGPRPWGPAQGPGTASFFSTDMAGRTPPEMGASFFSTDLPVFITDLLDFLETPPVSFLQTWSQLFFGTCYSVPSPKNWFHVCRKEIGGVSGRSTRSVIKTGMSVEKNWRPSQVCSDMPCL